MCYQMVKGLIPNTVSNPIQFIKVRWICRRINIGIFLFSSQSIVHSKNVVQISVVEIRLKEHVALDHCTLLLKYLSNQCIL